MGGETGSPDLSEHHPLDYQSGLARDLPHSHFGVVAVGVLAIAFVLFFVVLARRPVWVFQTCVGLWLVGIVFTAAAYARKKDRSLVLAHLALVLILVDFFLTTLLPSI